MILIKHGYFISHDLNVARSGDHSFLEGVIKRGEYFSTEEAAEKHLKKILAWPILKRSAKGFEPDWTNHDKKHYVYVKNGSLHTSWVTSQNYGNICFKTHNDAIASMENHPKEWVDYLRSPT